MKGAHSRPSGLGNDGCVGSTFFSTFAERFLLFSASNLPLFRDNTGHCCWLFARGLSQKRIPEEEGMLSCGCARVYLGSSLATSQHNSTASCRSWKRPWYGLETLPIHSDEVPVTEVALSCETLLANYSVSLVCSINGNWNKDTRFLDL